MSIFDLSVPGDVNLNTEAKLNPVKPEDMQPTVGAGFGKGLVLGVARGGAKAGRAVAIAGQALPSVIDDATGGTGADAWYQENVLKPTDTAVDFYTPRAGEVGKAGQIIGGLAEIALPLAATGGNPALLVGSEALNTERNLTRHGVDQQTASEVGLTQGVATAIGFKLPFLGSTLTTRMASGAGGNLAVNAGAAGVQAETLKAGGYDAQAAQFNPLDTEARVIDTLTGMAFGALAHVTAPRAADAPPVLKPSEQAAVLTANNGKHFQFDTAPGMPTDVGASTIHQNAMETATDQLTRGQPVNLDGVVTDAAYQPRPTHPAVSALTEAVREAYRPQLPAGLRWQPSQALASLPVEQRRALPFNAPELNSYAAHVEQQYQLPPGLLNALKNSGERSNSGQVSPAGARGVMQFMPENLRKFGVKDATDPAEIIDAAGRYLQETVKRYGGNIDAVIADYNGGPRQAREVLAGRQPKAKETRAYLDRVRRELGQDAEIVPPPALAAADVMPGFPEQQAGYARAIDTEISSTEQARQDLLATIGGQAALGEVTRTQAELPPLQQRLEALTADTAVRDLAKELQASRPRTSFKQAMTLAEKQRDIQVTDLKARIGRLEGFLQQNRDASQAAQQLVQLDERLQALRDNRSAIEVPATAMTPLARGVREAASSPIPQGPFGPILTGYKGDPQGAIAKLREMKSGEAVGALHHPDIGDIDLVWGVAGTGKSDGYGLSKLVDFHSEVLDDLQGVLDGMHVRQRSKNRIRLESADHEAAVRLEWDGREKRWLLTAYAKKGGDAATRTNTGRAPEMGDSPSLATESIVDQKSDDFDIHIAQQALADVGDIQLPTGAIDADGKAVTVSARELLAQADTDIQRAQQESSGFMAAVTCFLQRGT